MPMSFSKFVAIALVCYLGYILFRAHGKLRERKIGTVFQMMGEKTVKEISNLHCLITILCDLFKQSFSPLHHTRGKKDKDIMVIFLCNLLDQINLLCLT